MIRNIIKKFKNSGKCDHGFELERFVVRESKNIYFAEYRCKKCGLVKTVIK